MANDWNGKKKKNQFFVLRYVIPLIKQFLLMPSDMNK